MCPVKQLRCEMCINFFSLTHPCQHWSWCRPQGNVSLWRNLSPLANVAPCQRRRGFKTARFGRLHHLQAIFQTIHLSGIMECPILSTPGGVTSYHKPPGPLLIKRDGRFRMGRIVKKKGGCTDGETGWTSAVSTLRGEETTAGRQIARCSLLTPGLRASEEIHLASSRVPADSSRDVA